MANLFSIDNGKITYNKVNSNNIQKNITPKNNIKQKKKKYKEELNIQNKMQNSINEYFGKRGVMVNTNNWGDVSRTPYAVQQQYNYTKNGFSYNPNSLTDNIKLDNKFHDILKTDDYQQQKQALINQSNVVGYSKYDYDKAVVDADKVGMYDKSIGRLIEGAKSIFDISGGMLQNENGDYVYLPNKTELKAQKVNDSYETGIGKFLGNATYEIGKIGGTTLINGVAPYVGSTAYFGRMFMDSTNNAIREGYTQDKAINYALANTTLEFVTGKLIGSATKGLTGGANSQLSNAISNGINKLIKNPSISSFIGNAGSEATEEFIQEYLDNINRLVTLEGSKNVKDYIDVVFDKNVFEDALYSAGIGAVSGGVLGSINNTETKNIKQNKELFNTFKTKLEETKSNLTNKNEIAKYDKVINSIDDYLKRPFGNETKVQKILPTVQQVVAQEKNSATASNANIPRLTSETDSGTSSIANNNTNIIKNQDNLNIKQYTDNDINRFLTGDNLIDGVNAKLNSFVEKYYDPITKKAKEHSVPTKTQKMFLGRISDSLAGKLNTLLNNSRMIQEKIGKKYDTKDTNIVISSNNIEHCYNHHGVEKEPGQIDVTPENLSKYSEVVSNPDYIGLSSQLSRGKTPTIYFTKKINGYSVAVEVLSTKKQLYPESYYVFKSDSKEYLDFIKNNKLKKAEDVVSNDIMSNDINAQGDTSVAFSDNNIPQVDKNVKLPVISNNNTQNVENNTNKILNPNEISKLSLKDANTTPILPNINVSTGRGESHFAKNIENKTNMLSKESKAEILDASEVRYYQEISNKGSLERAFKRLKEGGESETLNWFNKDSTKATDVDVAEGWILLKQYQDKIQKTTDLATKDDLNRAMVQVAKKMREMGTKAGQTVQAYNILNRLTPEGMVYYAQSELTEAFDIMSKNKTAEWIENNRENFNITPQETEFIMKTMQEVQQMEDGYNKRVKLAEIQKLMTDKLPPTKGSGIKAWMRISMLFNPKTQVRNVLGNAVIAPVNAFSDLFASVIDKQIAKKTGVRTTGTTDIKSYLSGFSKGAYQSYNDFKKGINTRNIQGNRFEITEGKSFNDETSIGKSLNRIDSLLSFMLDAGDRTFYEATFTNSINNQLKLNNTSEVTQDMIDIATQEALSRTWQDNNGYTKFVLNVRKGLNALNIGGYGLGDVLIPFAKTPANLTKAIVDYSPLGLINTLNKGINLKRSLNNGQYNSQLQHQFVQNLGKATAGSMLYILGIALAKAGITSGESDDDKDVANFLKNTLGISSYSIKIGNTSFTYDWAQPIAAPLAITSNIVQKQKEGANLYENIISSLDTAGNILLEQSFLESLNTVLSNNEGVATGIQEAVLELPSRAVPTLFKQIADLMDPVQRQSFEKDKPLETAINKVISKVPIASKTLAPSIDTMGREIKKYGGKNNIFNVFLNPANVNTENISKSAEEIYRLYKSTGETNIMPRVAPYYINQAGEKINLNSSQREKYQKVSGKIIEDNINKLLKTTEYKNMTDKEKAEVISNVVNYSYNIAKKEILDIELSNTYEKAYEYSKIGNISDYYSFKASINDTNKDTKRTSITNYLVDSKLDNKQLAFLYGSYYSNEETLNNLLDANIPIKEFIKFNSQEFTTDYYTNGKVVSNSRQLKVIKYINGLNLSIAQKAILIKMEYGSYDKYDKQIVSYINKQNLSKFEKASLLKSFGFDNYDKYLIQYVNNMNITKVEKEEMLKEMGFTIRNGRVYS